MCTIARRRKGASPGFTLIEVLVAVAVLGIIATTFLASLTTTYKSVIVADEQTKAESLVRSEMEYVKDSEYWTFGFSYRIPDTPDNPPPWDESRTELAPAYSGYSVSVTGTPIDPDTGSPLGAAGDLGLQQVLVEVYHEDQVILTSTAYKVSR
jgi:prepilin-type N-terminal cleavage/methylation domain-containing protein